MSWHLMGSVLMYASERSSHCQNRGDLSIRREVGGREKSCGVRKSDGNRKVGEGGRERERSWPFEFSPTVMFGTNHILHLQSFCYFLTTYNFLLLWEHLFSSQTSYFWLTHSHQVGCIIWMVPLMVWTTSNWTDHCTLRAAAAPSFFKQEGKLGDLIAPPLFPQIDFPFFACSLDF